MSVTRVKTRWLIAWDGSRQRLIPRGELVHRNDQVIFVGQNYMGDVDEEIDARHQLVIPGLINLHVHAGSFAIGRLYADYARREPLMLGFLHYAAPKENSSPLPMNDVHLHAEATLAELLRNGCSTVVEIGGETGVPSQALISAASRLGLRLYTGIGFRSADYWTSADGLVKYRERPDKGEIQFKEAIDYAELLLEQNSPFIKPILFPLQVDTCNSDLLKRAKIESDRLGILLQIHAAQGLFEYQQIMQKTGYSPLGYLDTLGLLSPRTILAHAVYRSGHSHVPFATDDDLKLISETGTAVVHCPTVLARRGIAIESFETYKRAGIRMAIGTDTYPRDLIQEARLAMYISRVLDRDSATAGPWELLSATTNQVADILGRPDLGRLAPGCQADYLRISFDRLRHGPVYDPISSLFHTAVAEDISDVVIAGIPRMSERKLPVDEGQLLARQQQEAEHGWQNTEAWHFQAASADMLAPETSTRLWSGVLVADREGG